jgi:GH25 family lysozyme M1 (1,4-beta-N-acetylmuramidase)/5-hydroxyisourate hydrolase-like protein (transthyretin family)
MRHRSPLVHGLITASLAVTVAVPVALFGMPGAAAAKVYDGPDVASYQHPNPTRAHPHGQPINWRKVRRAGKEFAIVKATEGTGYVNPDFAGPYFHDYADARAAGLVHGAYHFARPALPIVSSAFAQARFFANVVGSVDTRHTLPPALDLESTGGLNRPQLVTWAQDFMLKLRSITGRTPMLYTYPSFWTGDLADPTAVARYPLWMASYGTARAPVADMWQYTSTAHIKGIFGNVDVSKFLGKSGVPWSTISDGTVHTPWQPAAPAAPVSASASISGNTATVHWMPGDTGTRRVTKYVVVASHGGGRTTVNGTHFAATFENLAPQTTYTFTVTAVNSVDSGVRSRPTNPVTPILPTKLKASADSVVNYGDPLSLQTKLTRTDTGDPLARRRVLVYHRATSAAAWKRIDTLRTDASGRADLTLTPRRSGQLESVFPGTRSMARAVAYTKYAVRPVVTSTLSSDSVVHGGTVTMSGGMTPAVSHVKVTLQRLVNGAWLTSKTTTRTGPRGRYIFDIRPRTPGTYVLRALVAAADGRAATHSHRVRLTVS